METSKLHVKDMLKDKRTAQAIANDIIELENAKSSYRHFLASYEAQLYCDNVIEVSANLEVVKSSLRELYSELEEVKLAIKKSVAPKNDAITYQWSDLEINAVNAFNSNKQFSITE